ncbi:hypothetical protein FOC1_g10005937 [Fusarium oxysporum f. sp. cubense race 1]|nr:hypothetical protein FOC1_g10005937 [Fusarium oxysporum f. sp. cubense race 1]
MNPKIECQCGAVQITASRPQPLSVYCCHCTECQKQSASAFDEGNTLECYFCKTCGVRVLHRSVLPDGQGKPYLSVKGGCVEGLSWENAEHIYTRSARVPVPEGSYQTVPGA